MQIVSDLKTASRAVTPNDGSSDLEGYYCIQTKPYLCACCPGRQWVSPHYRKKMIVWQEKDDPNMLKLAGEFKKLEADPRIVEYKPIMGKAIDWEDIPANSNIG